MSPRSEAQVFECRFASEEPAHVDHGPGVRGDLERVEVVTQAGPVAGTTARCVGARQPAEASTFATSKRTVDGAGSPCTFGGVLSDVPGHLRVGHHVAVDGPKVELLAPDHGQEGGQRWEHLSRLRSRTDGVGQNVRRCSSRRVVTGPWSVQPEDGVEVNQPAGLELGDLGDGHSTEARPVALADPERPRRLAIGDWRAGLYGATVG